MRVTYGVADSDGRRRKRAGEAAGAGRLSREDRGSAGSDLRRLRQPAYTSQGKGSITPYGRIELDAIYSISNTNPLDPGQFNGYATAAGKSSNASSTFNPRYSVFGLRADRTDGTHVLTGVVETDFYSQTDNAGNIVAPSPFGLCEVFAEQQQDERHSRYGLDAGHGSSPEPHRLLDHGVQRKPLAASSSSDGTSSIQ